MNDIMLAKKAFHESAVKSYIASRMLVSTSYLALIGLYNAHLACECMLKSLIAQGGQSPLFKHDLLLLLRDLRELNTSKILSNAQIESTLAWLNPYQELGRYGAQARPDFDPNRVDTTNLKAFGVESSQPSEDIEKIDHIFISLISLSDEPGALVQVLDNVTSKQWGFPVSIQEVILTQNSQIN